MGRISEDDVIRVREATDIVALVAETVPLKQKGRLYWGNCPFHQEKTPSFKVDPVTQLWHCFGCSLGGDAFGFVMRSEHMEFPDAVRRLAERARIEIREEEGGLPTGHRERLTAACGAAAEFFATTLTSSKDPGAAAARDYLSKRGFGSDVAKRWALGYAPGARATLAGHLGKAGFTRDELVAANLALVDDGARGPGGGGSPLKDRFFNRIMFPIIDINGRTIAFGGRVVGAGEPKYLNSSDTPIFHKSANMYGINVAKNDIVKTGTAVVVEGYTDVIALHEAGVRNAVATLGTALTARHLKLLGRFAKRIVYLFDGDEAGMRAADRAAEFLDSSATPEAGSARVDLAVAVIPDGKDPADYVGEHGLAGMATLIEGSQPLLRFVVDRRLEEHDLGTPEGRAAALTAAAGALSAVRGSILAQDYANYIAGRLMTDFETVMRSVNLSKPPPTTPPFSAAEDGDAPAPVKRTAPNDAQSRAEHELLRLLVVAPELRAEARDLLDMEDALADAVNTRLASAILAAGDAEGTALFTSVSASEPELKDYLSEWLVEDDDREARVSIFRETLGRLKEFALRRQILRLQAEMNSLDAVKDQERFDDIFRIVAALRRDLEAVRSGTATDTTV
jgi:DNA primase